MRKTCAKDVALVHVVSGLVMEKCQFMPSQFLLVEKVVNKNKFLQTFLHKPFTIFSQLFECLLSLLGGTFYTVSTKPTTNTIYSLINNSFNVVGEVS